jgi:hypothetical protein
MVAMLVQAGCERVEDTKAGDADVSTVLNDS